MKNLKKLMSIILTVAMLMSLVVSTSAATFVDVAEDNSAYEAVEVLAALDILEGKDANNFDPDANIKRSEFAAVVCRAMNAEAAAAGSASDEFSDVPANHWAAGYIAWAADAEIVNGRGNGTFDPDANVTYQEAAKMIVAAMGWGPYAENKGGFPTGYMAVANTYDLLAGINVANYGVAADRKGVAKLVYNSFDAPLMDTSKITFGDDAEYEIFDGKGDVEKRTLLSQYHGIYKIKATVDATFKTAPESMIDAKGNRYVKLTAKNLYKFDADDVSEALNKDIAVDEDFTVLTAGDATANLMGYTVNAYVALNDDEKAELVAIVADADSVDELVIENPAVYVYGVDPVNGELKYWEDLDDTKPAKAELADEIAVYENGVLAEDVTIDDYADYVSMTLVGADEVYDKVFFTAYEYGLVEEIDAEFFELTLDTGVVINLDEALREDEPFFVNIYKDGAAIDFEDIKEGDLLNVVSDEGIDASEDWVFADIYVTNNTVEGSVETVDEDGEATVYTIDGEEYFICDAVDLTLNPGDAGTFILTITGDIYDAELTQVTSGNYGFILNWGIKEGEFDGEGNILQIKLIDKNNKVATYSLKANAYVVAEWEDGVFSGKTLRTAEAYDDHTTLAGMLGDDLDGRLVTFKANDKEITNLTFAGAETLNVEELDAAFNPKGNRLGANYLTDATVVFHVPSEDMNEVQVYSASALKESEDNYEGFVFDKNNKRQVGALLLTNELPFAGAENALAVVMSVSTGLDSEGYATEVLNFYQAGEIKSLAKASIYLDDAEWDFAAGSVIQYTTNAAGEINDVKVIYDYATGEVAENDGVYDYTFSYVTEIKSGYMDLEDGSSFDFDLEGTNVLWDTEKTIKKGLSTKTGTSYLKKDKSYNTTMKVENEETGVLEEVPAVETTAYYVLVKSEEGTAKEIVAYKVVTVVPVERV